MIIKKIGDILELQRGYDLPVSEMEGGDFPVVGSNGIVGYHNVKRSISPTITVGRSGSIGKVHYYEGDTWVHNTAMYISNFRGNNPLYLYYLLKNLNFENLKSSSVVPSLNRNYIYPMKVPFISDKSKQNEIVNTLYSIDQKITINKHMNKELEKMARQIYDYWFVQFDFPDEKGKPYKSSGGKMVYNSILKREIPEGWEVKNIFEVADVLYGFPFSTDYFTEKVTKIPVVRIRDIINNTISTYTNEEVDDIYQMKEGDLIIGMDGNFHMNFWHDNKCYLNQRCVRFRDKEEHPLSTIQLYYDIKPVLDNKQKRIQGSTVGHLLDSDIKEFWILYPPFYNKEIKKKFDSLLFKIVGNIRETFSLIHLRDSLLPMLMNGQVTVE